jgi:predicted RNA-binding Zn-ribbon protein involved in translation (DUF1610 family)
MKPPRCLSCGKKFTAQSRFNRICPACHAENDGVVGIYKVARPYELELRTRKTRDEREYRFG